MFKWFFINCEMGGGYFFWTVSIMYWMRKLWLVKPHKNHLTSKLYSWKCGENKKILPCTKLSW